VKEYHSKNFGKACTYTVVTLCSKLNSSILYKFKFFFNDKANTFTDVQLELNKNMSCSKEPSKLVFQRIQSDQITAILFT